MLGRALACAWAGPRAHALPSQTAGLTSSGRGSPAAALLRMRSPATGPGKDRGRGDFAQQRCAGCQEPVPGENRTRVPAAHTATA